MSGLRTADPDSYEQIKVAYDSAMAAGKYVHPDGRRHYATTNQNEYWAEGAQWWFFSNYGECFAGQVKVETPEERPDDAISSMPPTCLCGCGQIAFDDGQRDSTLARRVAALQTSCAPGQRPR